MGTVIVGALVGAALLGLLIGGRHLYLRLDRPGGFECSLRVRTGEVDGLGAKFRAGYAGPEPGTLFWRRIARPGPGVRFPAVACRIDRARRPVRGERLAVPATFSIIPVEIDSDTTLELALPHRRLRRLVGLLGDSGPRRSP
jgi:hypothetical protein